MPRIVDLPWPRGSIINTRVSPEQMTRSSHTHTRTCSGGTSQPMRSAHSRKNARSEIFGGSVTRGGADTVEHFLGLALGLARQLLDAGFIGGRAAGLRLAMVGDDALHLVEQGDRLHRGLAAPLRVAALILGHIAQRH